MRALTCKKLESVTYIPVHRTVALLNGENGRLAVSLVQRDRKRATAFARSRALVVKRVHTFAKPRCVILTCALLTVYQAHGVLGAPAASLAHRAASAARVRLRSHNMGVLRVPRQCRVSLAITVRARSTAWCQNSAPGAHVPRLVALDHNTVHAPCWHMRNMAATHALSSKRRAIATSSHVLLIAESRDGRIGLLAPNLAVVACSGARA